MYRVIDRSKDGMYMKCKNFIEGQKKKRELCGTSRTCRSNSWFSHSRLTVHECLTFTYLWWCGHGINKISKEVLWGSAALGDWASFCRDVAIEVVLNNSQPIGGPGIYVDIDESKCGKSE